MVDALEAFGIRVEAAHHEVAAGQHEIDFEYADALRTADNAVTFKFALKAIAQQHGLYATFMPKPIHGINGSGMHTHQSACGRSPRAGTPSPTRRTRTGCPTSRAAYMAGILAHARGMIAILAPLVNSYKRLVPGYEAPTYLTWGRTNRSALIRVPKVSPGKSIEGTRVEVRCPDPSSNTYLAFAAMIAAGLDGVERGLDARRAGRGEPVRDGRGPDRREGDPRAARHAGRGDRRARARPGHRATRSATTSCRHYVAAKRAEWDEYRTQVTRLGARPLPRGLLTSRHHSHRAAESRESRMTARQTAIAAIAGHRVGTTQDYLEHAGADIYGQYVFGEDAQRAVPGQADLPASCAGRSRATSRSTRRSSTRSRTA